MIDIVSDNRWQEETSRYIPRLEAAIDISAELKYAIKTYWPGCFFPTRKPSRGASVAIKLGVYTNNVFSTSLLISRAIVNQWRSGLFVLVPLSNRFVIESWGAIHFARRTLDRLIQYNDVEREENRVNRLTFGSRSDVQLPWGGLSNETSFNVTTFIESLSDVNNQAEEFYNFLSEACHPNFIQSMYFQMAGPPLANWNNDNYKEHAHKLLNKTVTALGASMSGIHADVTHVMEAATNYVNTETELA